MDKIDKKPTLEHLTGKDLLIDTRYQRAIEENHVKRLRREWDEALVGVLIGCRREDGKVRLIDGMQRFTAKCGHDYDMNLDYVWDVYVHEHLTLPQEAGLFVKANTNRKNVTAYYVFRAGLLQQQPVALAIEKVLVELDLKASTKSTREEIACVAAMARIVAGVAGLSATEVNEARVESLRFALGVYADAWINEKVLWRSEHVEALAQLYRSYGEKIDRPALTIKLANQSPLRLLEVARSRAVGSNRVVTQLAAVFAELHDHGKRTANKLLAAA